MTIDRGHSMKTFLLPALIGATAFLAAPAMAQDATAAQSLPPADQLGDMYTIGVGAGYIPDYEGSDDYRIIPAAAFRASVNGYSISTVGTSIQADVIRKQPGQKIKLDFGPIVGVRLNRTGKVKDDLVDRLPELKTAFELGAFGGVTAYGLTNPYDSLTFKVSGRKDVGKAHRSTIITPEVSFSTPLSKTFYVSASASADWAGDKYADYYFSVTPEDSLASTLPVYNADGGFKDWKLGLLANASLSGDLRKGFSLFGMANYSHLAGDFADSPLVADRGSASQWLFAAGLGYSW
jgi:outer membrane scaffolding protein for murein synthesis (MipA/OmpV family)